MLGVHLPQSGTWSWLVAWPVDPVALAFIVVTGLAYRAGLRRVRARGADFPRSNTVSFWGGLVVLAIALLSPLDTYADVSFTVHMTQHLLLTFLAPPLLALGAPITLALRALPQSSARRLAGLLRGGVATLLSNPVVGWILFVSVPYAIHFSPLFDAALRNTAIHAFEHGIWVIAALIYWWPIVGRDPSPHPMTYPARLLSQFLAMPAMSFLALPVYTATHVLYPSYAALPPPWGPRAIVEQGWAATEMWLTSNLALIGAMLIVAVAWKHDEESRQRRLDRMVTPERLEAPRP